MIPAGLERSTSRDNSLLRRFTGRLAAAGLATSIMTRKERRISEYFRLVG